MGKCCSKAREHETPTGGTQEESLADPGGGDMTGGTLVARSTPGRWTTTSRTGGSPKMLKSLGPNATASVTRTFHFANNGTAKESVIINTDGGYSGQFTVKKNNIQHGGGGGYTRTKFSTGTGQGNKQQIFIRPTKTRSMGKTSVETTTRTYTKDGKRFEETVVKETKEDDAGNISTTTKTTTRQLDPYDTKHMSDALEGAKTGRGGRTSSSSSDSSPDRAKSKTKTKKSIDKKSRDSSPEAKSKSKSSSDKTSKGGLLSRFKSKGDGSDSDSSDDEEFAESVHKAVNECRKKHGVNKLKLSKEMNKYAKEWAKKLAKDEKMSHQPDNKYGENIFCLSSNSKTFKVKADEVVDKWYAESKDHTFGAEPKGTLLKSGHFTQLVWKDTKEMGVAKARSAAGTKVFVVANFNPQGNWMGQFADQVPPVGGFPKTSSGKTGLLSKVKSRKSSSSSSSESSSDEEDFAEDCLKSHNNFRKKHGAPLLKLNKQLNKHAKEWAETLAKRDVMQHRQPNEYGENLYCAWSSNPKHMIKGSEAVDSWYEEIKDFTFGREPADLRAGHFTQVVWQDTKELGVAMARSKTGKIYVVANYKPAGNMVGSFGTKVPRLRA